MSRLTPDGRFVVAGRSAAQERAQSTIARKKRETNEPPRCRALYCWHRAAEHDDAGSCRYVTRYVVEPYDRECKCETYTAAAPPAQDPVREQVYERQEPQMSLMDYDPDKDEDGPTYCTKCGWDECRCW